MNNLFLKLYVALRSACWCEDGQNLTEYVLAVGLIALGCVAGEATLAHNVNQVFTSIATVILNGVTNTSTT